MSLCPTCGQLLTGRTDCCNACGWQQTRELSRRELIVAFAEFADINTDWVMHVVDQDFNCGCKIEDGEYHPCTAWHLTEQVQLRRSQLAEAEAALAAELLK